MKEIKIKLLIPILAVSALVSLFFLIFNETYESNYLTVKLTGDADEFNGFINFLNDKGEVEGVTLENELPQEHRMKTHKLYVHLELVEGEHIFVEYFTKGDLIRKDTVYSGLYKRNINVEDED
jgi:hypothetical protein